MPWHVAAGTPAVGLATPAGLMTTSLSASLSSSTLATPGGGEPGRGAEEEALVERAVLGLRDAGVSVHIALLKLQVRYWKLPHSRAPTVLMTRMLA